MSCCKGNTSEGSVVKVYPSTFIHDKDDNWNANYNLVTTNKYRFWNFIFLNLYEQFKRFSNIFFIGVVILNFIPEMQTYSKETSIIPIAFVLLTSMIKDGYEDIQRWKNDRVVNNRFVQIYNKDRQEFILSFWKELKVGDMVKLSSNERIPADLLLYQTSDTSGQCFIETTDIDGESNLKQRTIFKPFKEDERCIEGLFGEYYLAVEAPNKEIYKFNGKIMDARSHSCSRMIKHTNIVLRDTILRNTEEIRGLVVYAGNETKTLMNNKKPRFKRSLLEHQLNIDIIWCIFILIIVCLMTTVGNIFWVNSLVDINSVVFYSFTLSSVSAPVQGLLLFLSSIIVYQVIIPLPLYITLELVKAHQILHITSDINLYDKELDKKVEVRAYNITEDMGQIKYMFCDKTGTLTENIMVFKKASIGEQSYLADDSLVLHLADQVDSSKPLVIDMPMKDFLLTAVICNTTVIGKKLEKKLINMDSYREDSLITGGSQLSQDILSNLEGNELTNVQPIDPVVMDEYRPIPKDLLHPEFEISESVHSRSSITMIAKSVNSINKPPTRHYNRTKIKDEDLSSLIQSESPDEDALVKFAYRNGYELYQRNVDILTIWNEHEKIWIDFEILKTLPFDSIRKCMTVIVRSTTSSHITMYCKGADSVMFQKIKNESPEDDRIINKIKSDIHTYACDGLRTLVMAKRELSQSEFDQYEIEMSNIEASLVENEEDLRLCYNRIESNLHLIGAAGIEDKLQDQVPEILECFKEAGINIWILTGDKRETAINIAYSSRLFNKNEVILEVTGDDEEEILTTLRNHRLTIEQSIYESKREQDKACSHTEFGLVIDGCSLSVLFDSSGSSAEETRLRRMKSDELKNHFFQITYFCNSVVCCRCTPIQKANVVSLIRNKFHVRTLAVGDGANDVNMIQTADIGIGIGGREGMQATMAADFAICKFKYIKRLILVHGHWCYDRLARMSLYIFYKDMFIAFVYFFYQIVCGFSMSTAIDQISQLVFHIIHTGLPPLVFGIWDKDFDDRILMANPSIYKTGINSKMYRFRDFWRNVTDSIWQALCVSILCYLCYYDTEIGMAEFGVLTVSAVIITMFGHILIESKHWNPLMWFSCIGCLSIGFYLELFILNSICVVLMDCNTDNPYKVVHYVMAQGKTYVVLAVVVSLALFPRIFFKSCLGHCRDSISYEAQHRINQRKISRKTSNITKLREESEFTYQFNHKESRYHLGNLEEFKKIECTKCDFREAHFSQKMKPSRKVPANRVAPLSV